MSTKAMPWFRMYTDFLNDPKLIALAFEDQRHFIGVLALKGDGTLDNKCAPELMNRIVAQRLWVDYAVIGEVKKRLVAAGLIDDNWQPLAWEKRQMRSDTSTERVRAHRAKAKQSGNGGETFHETNDVTDQERSSNGLDTDTEGEKEGEKDKKQTHTRKRGADVSDPADEKPLDAKALVAEGVRRQHAVDWLVIRKAKRLPLTPTAWGDVKDEAAKCGMTPATAVEHAVKQNWASFKAKWIAGDQPPGSPAGATLNKQEQLEANNRAVAQRAAERFQAQQGAMQ
ncbi:hypothetical protein [Burkholderia vietnamiensis]|uniref:hypothetical protein n=1 Tax=Burkholderia vietnamiensis TaxID=60552 RepID=UPI001CF40CC2|nr:hypothetical protein [Burkholderia vietnamiensis]MCA8264823.1 hypothetical protein [Burkholderia vietnamiensis]HDR8927864.1 hypothetical protein [Burkholderia vietnamiensis]